MPGSVSVSVENGSGVYGQATQTAQALSGLGFNVVSTGTTTPVGQEAETVVTYAHRTAADEAAAQLVARSLSGSVIMAYGPTPGGATVTVTTGTGFTVDTSAPAPASATSTTEPSAKATTTTTTAPSATTVTPTTATATTTDATPANAEGFAAPSSSNEPLSPWDPRSCTPSGGPGS